MSARICFITAIYGDYDKTCKKFVKQTVDADFICFTNNDQIQSNGWKIDTTPYHLQNKSELDNDKYNNSLCNNMNNFNVAKYYKQSFQKIPILQGYDAIVWMDGTIEIIWEKTGEWILNKIGKEKIIGWHHEFRMGNLKLEVNASHNSRYLSTSLNGQPQSYQDVDAQYKQYLADGYSELFFKKQKSHTPNFGVWITCFVAFNNKDPSVTKFLDMWYLQTLKYTTQDQIGFSYVAQKTRLLPYTLPNKEILGPAPHDKTQFYIKHSHGK